MADAAPQRRLTPLAFAALFAVMLGAGVGNNGLISVMPAIGRQLGIPDALVATIFSLSAGLWAVTSPYWARQSDRRGRRRYILVGMAGFVGSMTACGLVVLAGIDRLAPPLGIFAAFFLIRSSYGLFGPASSSAAQAYVADHSEGQVRVRALSALAGAVNLGAIFGPALAPFLIFQPVTIAGPMFVYAVGGLAIIAMIALSLDNDRPPVTANATAGATLREILRDAAIRPHLVYAMAISSAQAINIYTLGFVVIDRLGRPPAEAQAAIGTAMAAGAAAQVAAQWALVPLLKMRPRTMMRWGALGAVAGNVVIALGTSYTSLLGAFVVACLGYGLARPGSVAGASLAAGPRAQGAVAGAVSSIAGASIAIPPVIAVALYQARHDAPFVLTTLIALVLLAYAYANPALRTREIVSGER